MQDPRRTGMGGRRGTKQTSRKGKPFDINLKQFSTMIYYTQLLILNFVDFYLIARLDKFWILPLRKFEKFLIPLQFAF